ncbi:hypothetical protein JYQ62_29120 [Nostoc sp. UHCC 0702]|nr:hypothetical protein JYQ62_29120 [Nostoc sp. UHCC 0702]
MTSVVMNLRSPLLKFDLLQVTTGILWLSKLKYLCIELAFDAKVRAIAVN